MTVWHMPQWLDPDDDQAPFPDPETALTEPNGLLAFGGSLNPQRLIAGYRRGVFPWYCEDQPILWWSPDPRGILFPDRVRISRSLRKTLRRGTFHLTMDHAFSAVVAGCAAPRAGEAGTWITPGMQAAYERLHHLGWAHSVEVWQGDALVGGLYGVALGGVFFGESMFSRVSDASKAALVCLAQQLDRWGFGLIDCQLHTPHLASLGAEACPRRDFLRLLRHWSDRPAHADWHFDPDLAGSPAQGVYRAGFVAK